jgi:hypothetical protein
MLDGQRRFLFDALALQQPALLHIEIGRGGLDRPQLRAESLAHTGEPDGRTDQHKGQQKNFFPQETA